MPYPSQLTYDSILDTACALIEQDGAEALSLHKLAAALGVKAPSLYRYFAGKPALLAAINTRTVEAFTATLQHAAAGDGDPAQRLMAMANAFRAYAHAHPTLYLLMYGSNDPDIRPDDALLPPLALPIQAVFAQIAGETQGLHAMAGGWALLHGFVMLEINAQFRRLDDADRAFEVAMRIYLAGWASAAASAAQSVL